MTFTRSTTANSGTRGRVAFRVDASSDVGGGHAYRCLALADALAARGAHCWFVARAGSVDFVPGLARHDRLELGASDPNSAVAAQLAHERPEGVDWLVVDHYELGADFENACRPWARRILAIDDLADRPHAVDLLVDQSPGRVAADYTGLLGPDCPVLAGSRYALLRPGFSLCRARSLARRATGQPVQRVLVGFGASDPGNLACHALALMRSAGLACNVEVILGPNSPNSASVRGVAAACPFPVDVFDGVDDMAARLASADLAIGGGGVSALERACLGVPSLLVILADNQQCNADYLGKAGAALVLESSTALKSPAATAALRALADSPRARQAMSQAAAGVCDGAGSERVAACMLERLE